jgi:hypothetical protein
MPLPTSVIVYANTSAVNPRHVRSAVLHGSELYDGFPTAAFCLFNQEAGALLSRLPKVQVAGKLTVNVIGRFLKGLFDLTIDETTHQQK